MSFNQKRGSITSSASFSQSVNPRRLSSYGHVMAGTGALPSAHTAAIKSSINSNSGSKRPSSLLLNPLQTQHRNRTLKARVARMCPSIVHGAPRRRRSMLAMLCAGSVIVLIYFLSSWDVQVSTKDLLSSYKKSADSSDNNHIVTNNNKPAVAAKKEPIVYKNPDGSDMSLKSIFMIRDFGRSECERAFDEKGLSAGIKKERERNRDQSWSTVNREDAWEMSLSWKRRLKEILPNFKDYNAGWIGQGVVLTAFFREGEDDRETMIEDLLLQIKMLRGLSTIPIEVWFESVEDITAELHQSLAEWGTLIRALDDDSSTAADAIVETPENDSVTGTTDPAITLGDIEDFKARDPSPAQLQKALTVAALINSGFEDIIFYSPTTLPLQSPRVVFQQDQFVQTGAVFWQHPTMSPAHDSPIWPIAQTDCIPDAHVQSWSAVALKHKESWKGLFVAWEWLTGQDMDQFESFLGSQGNDLLRLAWLAIKRQYAMIDRMPEAGLVDMSQTKGSGVGCSLGSHLYPVPGATILTDLKQHAEDQRLQRKMYQQSQRYGLQEEFFLENTNVMMVDTSRESGLLSLQDTVSNDRHLNSALDEALMSKDPTKLLLVDGYAAGPGGRVCVRISRQPKGHRHDV
ncbi:hypothetical protein EMPS_03277 [Entomortierella parvispora]|uniref:Uncharacterized protein n=1 Tax=Entomortierella parvispora TaxID=205924 RepID=A0A9P3LUF5_9FUNG|nr:hypothetical protein EMPS_03277 [Entomortierella parvispora]